MKNDHIRFSTAEPFTAKGGAWSLDRMREELGEVEGLLRLIERVENGPQTENASLEVQEAIEKNGDRQ